MAMKANYIALSKSDRKPVAGARLTAPANPDERMEVSVRLRRKTKTRPASERHISYQALGETYGSDASDLAKVTTSPVVTVSSLWKQMPQKELSSCQDP